jgi:two-component system response regulator BaeR
MIDKQAVNLTPNEFGLLKIMMGRPNRVFSRNELINRVQGYDFEGYDRTIDTHIKNLRKKIAVILPDQEIIITVYGVGYKFNTYAD